MQRNTIERRVDIARAQERLQRRREAQPSGSLREIERFDSQPVAREGHHTGVGVDDGEREHPDEVIDAVGAPRVERLDDHFTVGVGEEAVALALEFCAQFLVVVDAAVEHHRETEFGVDHRLRAAFGQVDDLEPSMPECHRPLHEQS